MRAQDKNSYNYDVWAPISQGWYFKASFKAPILGRPYYHLATLSPPKSFQRLFYLVKSLCVSVPFPPARTLLLSFFEWAMQFRLQHPWPDSFYFQFLKTHSMLSSGQTVDNLQDTNREILKLLRTRNDSGERHDVSARMAIINCCALLSYGKQENAILKSIQTCKDQDDSIEGTPTSTTELNAANQLEGPLKLFEDMSRVFLAQGLDADLLPYLHVQAVFLLHVSQCPVAMKHIEKATPWSAIAEVLTGALQNVPDTRRLELDQFPGQDQPPDSRLLPEDFDLRGLVWTEAYFPEDWFSSEVVSFGEDQPPIASAAQSRIVRVLWIFFRLMQRGNWLEYDRANCRITPASGRGGVRSRSNMDGSQCHVSGITIGKVALPVRSVKHERQ